uniref:Uncharacterized protein n=1 Tax=Arion vulgaris TaxID=1028688 RepID=A0A0B7A9I3_9EUPU
MLSATMSRKTQAVHADLISGNQKQTEGDLNIMKWYRARQSTNFRMIINNSMS